MKLRFPAITAAPLLLLVALSCEEKVTPEPATKPAIKAQLVNLDAFRAVVEISSVQTSYVLYGIGESREEAVAAMTSRAAAPNGTVSSFNIEIENLEPDTGYWFLAKGVGKDGSEGNTVSLEFITPAGPDDLYSWERERKGAPSFKAISLVTRGQHNYNPPLWSASRFAPHVSYSGAAGEHWLFDAFLCTEGFDGKRGYTMSISSSRRYSATKESWEDLLDYWFLEGGALDELDKAVSDAASRIGTPPTPRYVVITIPDPIMYQVFLDWSSSTTYWGVLDGEVMDFSQVEHQIRVCKWFVDECRGRFRKLSPKHLELAGFYILSEELPLDASFYSSRNLPYSQADTWNAAYKRWETIVPDLSSYLKSCREGLYWIPYFLAPGHRVWKELGFNMAWMQPNHYWDTRDQHPMSRSVSAMSAYGLGMELEFEYSMVYDQMKNGRYGPDCEGNPTFTEADIPALRDRLREYMKALEDNGWKGTRSLALYSGTDALTQLASSPDSRDREMYLELCSFIAE